jgi:thermitase
VGRNELARPWRPWWAAFGAVALATCLVAGGATSRSAPPTGAPVQFAKGLGPTSFAKPGRAHVKGRILVRFRPGTPARTMSSLLVRGGASQTSRLDRLDVRVLHVAPRRLEAALRTLRASPSVEFAETDGVAGAADTIPNDPLWSSEWSSVTTRAPAAWDLSTGSSSVIVAVLDSGVDLTQPDLQGKLVAGWDEVYGDADPTDDNGHGTAVAGIVGASSNNALGVASYCWGCVVMPVKVLDATAYGSYSNIAAGITWATDHGARVINLSLAGTSPSDTLASAVQYAHDRGVVLVASAGNYANSTPVYPADYPEVLSVAGTDASDALYSWSNSWPLPAQARPRSWGVPSGCSGGRRHRPRWLRASPASPSPTHPRPRTRRSSRPSRRGW